MKVGVLKDIKVGEYRVIATPAEVSMLVGDGNEVYVQKGAGEGSGFPDEAYVKEGAKLVDTKEEIYATCDFVAKVKEFEPCAPDERGSPLSVPQMPDPNLRSTPLQNRQHTKQNRPEFLSRQGPVSNTLPHPGAPAG